MFRIRGVLPSRQMALGVPAIGGRDLQIIVVVDVARGTGHVGVPVGEQKACGAVVKFCA